MYSVSEAAQRCTVLYCTTLHFNKLSNIVLHISILSFPSLLKTRTIHLTLTLPSWSHLPRLNQYDWQPYPNSCRSIWLRHSYIRLSRCRWVPPCLPCLPSFPIFNYYHLLLLRKNSSDKSFSLPFLPSLVFCTSPYTVFFIWTHRFAAHNVKNCITTYYVWCNVITLNPFFCCCIYHSLLLCVSHAFRWECGREISGGVCHHAATHHK